MVVGVGVDAFLAEFRGLANQKVIPDMRALGKWIECPNPFREFGDYENKYSDALKLSSRDDVLTVARTIKAERMEVTP